MTPFRLAVWNVEWFDRLFDDRGKVRAGDPEIGRYGVSRGRQAEAVAHVLRHLDPDAALIVEAPDDGARRSARAALEGFAAWAGLRLSQTRTGFRSGTRQEIALMFDPAAVEAEHAPGDHPEAPRFDTSFRIDLDVDSRADLVRWSKPPLELDLAVRGEAIRLVGVHAKSKGLHGATGDEALRVAILNRRKQLAQCIWLRARVDARLAEGVPLIVAGDFNDGPGLDRFETLFGRSGVEIVLGEGEGALVEPHAVPPRLGAAQPATARFWDRDCGRFLNALLDFAMVSKPLASRARWRILHPFDDPEPGRDPALRDALLDASDHFPVVLELAPPA
ncbi:endonuclease/exonuclease/phosphatase family protein [Jannaschia sp. W003]|uniref:endonuclease/exonuclease/phosphatase family protein n=1 Tax=Jannaschia sp. W003 TaxID=2867012 RepID=UPI0021A35617|nr:endonuclease/exonuclease/phosphatase family protein [Jannaschia sp. W003]UWQ22515.1 endonuclease/exonuclease/phosphatase family protein [Jannaschia sp. W003]